MDSNHVTALLLAFLAFSFMFIKKFIEHRENTIIRYLVSWCVTEDSSIYRCSMHLYQYVFNAQSNLNIPQKYRLSYENDKDIVKEILGLFQAELSKLYFEGRTPYIKSLFDVPGEHYFMFALGYYLGEHHCDSCLCGHNMHNKTLSYKSYGTWGALRYNASYELSDFAIIYHKLYYIAYQFTVESKYYGKYCQSFVVEGLQRILDTNTIEISSMY